MATKFIVSELTKVRDSIVFRGDRRALEEIDIDESLIFELENENKQCWQEMIVVTGLRRNAAKTMIRKNAALICTESKELLRLTCESVDGHVDISCIDAHLPVFSSLRQLVIRLLAAKFLGHVVRKYQKRPHLLDIDANPVVDDSAVEEEKEEALQQTLSFDSTDTGIVEQNVETLIARVRDAQTTDSVLLSIQEMAVVEQAIAPQLEKARAKTEKVLSQPCAGRIGDENTVHHIMNGLCKSMGKEMVLFDSSESPDLPNSLMNLSVAFGQESQQLDIRLDNFKDLGLSDEEEKMVSVESLNAGEHGDVVQQLRERLAAVHEVPVDAIEIQGFYEGSKGIRYLVKHLTARAIKAVQDLVPKLKAQFNQFIQAKIHPLFYRTHFDVSMFDCNHHKDFSNLNEVFRVGPPGSEREYKQPKGWYRYALNVLGKYDNDAWIHPFGNPGMWYKAYHGTNGAQPVHFPNTQHLLLNDASVNAVANIYKNGFHVSGTVPGASVHGSGVYCAPDAERAYKARSVVETKDGQKTYEFLIMCAVRPGSFNDCGWCWVVYKKEDIRPYGLLVREV